MSIVAHYGSAFVAPPRTLEPVGEVSWLVAEPNAVSTSGPALVLHIDVSVPRWGGYDVVVVARVLDDNGYVLTGDSDWQDPMGRLAASATVRLGDDATLAQIPIALPYASFPDNAGGNSVVEVAIHAPDGDALAIAHFDVSLPEDVDRVPDPLTLTVHTLSALVRANDGVMSREEADAIFELLRADFQLDPLGERALKRILRTAGNTTHTPESLSEWLAFAADPALSERFVALLYACARADGEIQAAEQEFIDDLLGRLGIHDHQRFGHESLGEFYAELELEPGASFDDVKRAWKRMVRDYHPDRVQNLARGFHEYATRRTAAINDAYASLRAALDVEEDTEEK